MNKFNQPDNDDTPVGTILSRREALAAAAKAGFGLIIGGGAGSALAGASQAQKQVHLVATPEVEEGPFFVDEKLHRSNLVAGTKRETVTQGLPLALTLAIHTLKDGVLSPLPGAHVDIWHADAAGVYSDESNPINHEDTARQTWLRGYQISDKNGLARFETIFPGWYPSRTAHIHLKIRRFSAAQNVTAEFTTQLFFDDAVAEAIFKKAPYTGHGTRRVYNDSDGLFSQRQVDGTLAGSHLMLALKKAPSGDGHTAAFSIALTDGNFKARTTDRQPNE
jgi:protocatechuate 3,4-dioxygenase beta subunit